LVGVVVTNGVSVFGIAAGLGAAALLGLALRQIRAWAFPGFQPTPRPRRGSPPAMPPIMRRPPARCLPPRAPAA